MYKLLTLIFILVAVVAQAQVQFRVVDAITQAPLENVRVQNEQGQVQFTNASGILAFPSSTEQLFTFFKTGYAPLSEKFTAGEFVVELSEKSLNLSEITVTAFESERPLLEQSAAISLISERDFTRFNETSIVNSFNTKPGIRIEERAPASYRISIRGSSIRSPFGVRNVKVYWNEVPFTAPDGTTPLNLLDL
ncbi:MAG: Plug domain-containing protein, partial [Algoriphagus sp.]